MLNDTTMCRIGKGLRSFGTSVLAVLVGALIFCCFCVTADQAFADTDTLGHTSKVKVTGSGPLESDGKATDPLTSYMVSAKKVSESGRNVYTYTVVSDSSAIAPPSTDSSIVNRLGVVYTSGNDTVEVPYLTTAPTDPDRIGWTYSVVNGAGRITLYDNRSNLLSNTHVYTYAPLKKPISEFSPAYLTKQIHVAITDEFGHVHTSTLTVPNEIRENAADHSIIYDVFAGSGLDGVQYEIITDSISISGVDDVTGGLIGFAPDTVSIDTILNQLIMPNALNVKNIKVSFQVRTKSDVAPIFLPDQSSPATQEGAYVNADGTLVFKSMPGYGIKLTQGNKAYAIDGTEIPNNDNAYAVFSGNANMTYSNLATGMYTATLGVKRNGQWVSLGSVGAEVALTSVAFPEAMVGDTWEWYPSYAGDNNVRITSTFDYPVSVSENINGFETTANVAGLDWAQCTYRNDQSLVNYGDWFFGPTEVSADCSNQWKTWPSVGGASYVKITCVYSSISYCKFRVDVYPGNYPYGQECVGYISKTQSMVTLSVNKGADAATSNFANSAYSGSGIKYGIYNSGNSLVDTLELGHNGRSTRNSHSLPAGTYFVKELNTNNSYTLNDYRYKVNATTGGQHYTVNAGDTAHYGHYTIHKYDQELRDLGKNSSSYSQQGDGSLAGVQYTVKFYAVDNPYAYGDAASLSNLQPTRVWTIQTSEGDHVAKLQPQYCAAHHDNPGQCDCFYYVQNGDTKNYDNVWPMGCYTIQEIKVGEQGNGDGYKNDDTEVRFVRIGEGDFAAEEYQTTAARDFGEIDFGNRPMRGDISVQKYNAELDNLAERGGNARQGYVDQVHSTANVYYQANANMANAQMTLWNVSKDPHASGVSRQSIEFRQVSGNTTAVKTVNSVAEADLGALAAKLSDSEGNINPNYDSPEEGFIVTGTLDSEGRWTTDYNALRENGVLKTDSQGYLQHPAGVGSYGALPYGTYILKETKAPNRGFACNGDWYMVITIDRDGVTKYSGRNIQRNEENLAADLYMGVEDQILRDDLKFNKVNGNREPMGYTPFLVTSKSTGEWHVIVVGPDGKYNSAAGAMAGGRSRTEANTNMYDKYLVQRDGQWWLSADVGTLDVTETFFYGYPTGSDGSLVHSDLTDGAAFPYDAHTTNGGYTVREIYYEGKTPACGPNEIYRNTNYSMQQFEFDVANPGQNTTIDRTVVNREGSISSVAYNSADENTFGTGLGRIVNGVSDIRDVVHYKSIWPNEEEKDSSGNSYAIYYLVGKVIDKNGDPNSPIRTVIGEKFSVGPGGDGDAPTMFFRNISKSELDGKTVVIYETLYKVRSGDPNAEPDPSQDLVIAEHNDSDDIKQTLHYPWISSTTLTAATTGDHISRAKFDPDYGTIVLQDKINYTNLPRGNYTIKTELRDAAANVVIWSNTSAGENNILEVSSDFADGTRQVDITLEARAVYDAYRKANLLPDDLPEKYRNVTMAQYDSDMFTPEERLELSGLVLEGRTLVAFERVYEFGASGQNGLMAIHEDLTDINQSVLFPKIRTQVADGGTRLDNEGGPTYAIDEFGNKYLLNGGTIVDSIRFENMLPDRVYTIDGILMDRYDEGNIVLDEDGNPLVSNPSATYYASERNGTWKVEYDVTKLPMFDDDLNQIKHEFVAYEDVKLNGTASVAAHQSFDDPTQIQYVASSLSRASAIDDEGNAMNEACSAAETVKMRDTFNCTNLVPGEKYRIITEVREAGAGTGGQNRLIATTKNSPYEFTFEPTVYDGDSTPVFSHTATIDVPIPKDEQGDARPAVTYYIRETIYNITSGVPVIVLDHNNVADVNQQITFPRIHTTAFDSEFMEDALLPDGNLHIGYADADVTVVDRVYFDNLRLGNSYTIDGVLMDKTTGKELKVNGETFTASANITMTEDNLTNPQNTHSEACSGYVDLTFTIPNGRDALEGKTIVAFETLSRDGRMLDNHKDIDDEGQSVHYPKVRTHATSSTTGIREDSATQETCRIVDRVEFTNLVPGQSYTLTAVLMDKDATIANNGTPQRLRDDEGIIVPSKQVEFVPHTTDGNVDVAIELDRAAIDMNNRTIVVYETLTVKEPTTDKIKTVATHQDINDEEQTVRYPEIGTTALDNGSGIASHMGYAGGDVVITDTVAYRNLVAGDTYRVEGVLHYRDAQGNDLGVVKVGNNTARASKDFVAEKQVESADPTDANGTIDLTFPAIAGAELDGKSVVAFETIYKPTDGDDTGKEVANHSDAADDGQSVFFPNVGTTLTDDSTSAHEGNGGNREADAKASVIKLTDTVAYSNVMPSTPANPVTYKVSGVLMVKETGEALLDGNGHEITAEQTFSPTESSGTVDLSFTITGADVRGKTIVAFETLYQVVDGKDKKVGEHAVIGDESQSVHYPAVETTAADVKTSDNIGLGEQTVTVRDAVKVTNLIVGNSYTIRGTLHERSADGKDLGVLKNADGTDVTAETTFVARTSESTQYLVFTYTKDGIAEDFTAVAFEELYGSGDNLLGMHAQIEDEGQSVHYPKIRTTALDQDSGYHEGLADGQMKIVDTVRYWNLLPDRTYTMYGTLYDKSTEQVVRNDDGSEVTATLEFDTNGKPGDRVDGSVDLVFTISSEKMKDAANTFVVFEKLQTVNPAGDDVLVAVHTDLSDEDQSVHYPKIGTTATDSKTGIHEGLDDGNVVIYDDVVYTNLVPKSVMESYGASAYSYTVKGTLMDKETGTTITDADGNAITAETSFTPEKSDGVVQLAFNVSGASVEGRTTVVFEKVYHDKQIIAEHQDLNDEAQSVHYPKLRTRAVDSETAIHMAPRVRTNADGTIDVIDTVDYWNLLPGKEYTMTGTLMDKATGEPLKDKAGNDAKASAKFTTPDEPTNSKTEGVDGEVELTFESVIVPSHSEAFTAVAFEELTNSNGDVVGAHKDLSDEDQSVHYVEIGTQALDEATASHIGSAEVNKKLIDTVSYRNLVPGQEYVIKGVLVIRTSEATSTQNSASGKTETTEEEILPTTYHVGNVDGGQYFTADSTHPGLLDETVFPVAPGDYDVSVPEGYECEIAFTTQSDPSAPGNAYDKPISSVKLAHSESGATDAEKTGTARVTVPSNAVVAFKLSKVSEDGSLDGSVTEKAVTFKRVTATEFKIDDDKVSPASSAKSDANAPKALFVSDEDGNLITGEIRFTPEAADGEVPMTFDLSGIELAGKRLVAFEELYAIAGDDTPGAKPGSEILIAVHKDIDDEAQSVYYPEIHTTALFANGTDREKAYDVQVVNDTVTYENLVPGVEYTMKGTLHLKGHNGSASGSAADLAVEDETVERESSSSASSDTVKSSSSTTETVSKMKKRNNGLDDGSIPMDADGTILDYTGKRVEATAKFTPTSTSGSMVITFEFDARDMIYADLVVFEECYVEDNLVAQHADINDEAQTVHIAESGLESELIKNSKPASQVYKTGDGTLDFVLKAAFIAVVVGAMVVTHRRRNA